MKRNNVDAALIIEVSKPIAYGQYQFEKGDKLTYDMNSNLFIYRSESYSEDEDGTETTSIIAFGVDPDFVLDNADHFTCLIKKGILDKVEDDDKAEDDTDGSQDDSSKPATDTDLEEDKDTPDEAALDKTDFDAIINHADKLSDKEFEKEVIGALSSFHDILSCYDLCLRRRFLGRRFDGSRSRSVEVERRISDVICNLNWVLRAFHDEEKRAINDCVGEACDSAR